MSFVVLRLTTCLLYVLPNQFTRHDLDLKYYLRKIFVGLNRLYAACNSPKTKL